MKTGTKVRVIKEFTEGIVDFEVGDVLRIVNYIHKDGVYLKADGIRDLIRIKCGIINEYIEGIPQPNKEKLKEVICACLERVYNSDGMIECAKVDAMRAIDEFVETIVS